MERHIWVPQTNSKQRKNSMCPEKDQTIYIQEKEVKTVKTFKYLGSMLKEEPRKM